MQQKYVEKKSNIDTASIITSGVFGGIGGAIGGKGADAKNVLGSLKSCEKTLATAVSAKKTAQYAAKVAMKNDALITAAARLTLGSASSSMGGTAYRNLRNAY
ncbi:MAG: hypothetical protein VB106_17120 [Clostridiaceae bacterium]|nr:hypothetical protein [Clostridiaceae bacterium]